MKKDKVIMWMDKDGRYYGCRVAVGYKLSFAKLVEDCGQHIEPEFYKDAKEAKLVASQIVKTTDLSCAVIKATRYISAVNGNIKEETLEVSSVIVGKNEKIVARQKFQESKEVLV